MAEASIKFDLTLLDGIKDRFFAHKDSASFESCGSYGAVWRADDTYSEVCLDGMRQLKTIAYGRSILLCAKLHGHIIFGRGCGSTHFESAYVSR